MRAAGGQLTVTQGLCRPQGCGGAPPHLPPHLSGPTGKPPGSLWTLKDGLMAQEVPAGHDHSSPSPASSVLMETEVTLAGHSHEKAESLLRAHSRASHQLLGPGNLHADDSRSFAQGTPLPKVPPHGRTGRHPPAVLRALWGQPLPHPGLLRCRLPRAGRRGAFAAPGGAGWADRQAGRVRHWALLACSRGDTVWKNLQNQDFFNR